MKIEMFSKINSIFRDKLKKSKGYFIFSLLYMHILNWIKSNRNQFTNFVFTQISQNNTPLHIHRDEHYWENNNKKKNLLNTRS